MRAFRIGIASAAIAALAVIHAAPAHALFDQELKCSATLSKSFNKYHAAVLKTLAKCHNDDISGKANSVDACETLTAEQTAAITKAREKFLKKVNKDCVSRCTVTDTPCVADLGCPARHVGMAPSAAAERCIGESGGNPFSLRGLDWPGPYCETILGHAMTSVGDLEECVLALADRTIDTVDEAVFADLDETSGLTDDAAKCLSSIGKAVGKAIPKLYGPAAECRTARRDANLNTTLVYACALDDPDTVDSSNAAIAKLTDAIEKKCDDTAIASLTGLCGAGANPTTSDEAKDCLAAMVREVSNREHGFNGHVYAPFSMINVTHPHSAKAYCGDGVVTETREEHTGVGEECDGSDAPCGGGSCIPPGDLFECTCDNVARERFIVDGNFTATDSDAGWLGASHEATHNDGFGYVTELSDCSCDAFAGATCTTPSGDDVCNVTGNMAPRCSDDFDGASCDARGDSDGNHASPDCYTCDEFSINAGAWCANPLNGNVNENACQSQCIVDATGLPTMPATPCTNQEGCGAGETCRGRCDSTITCEKMTEGSPLPLVSADTFVCIMLEYQTDITGTKNIVTGETALNYTTESNIQLGLSLAEPCPVCAGTCIGGSSHGDHCLGRCDASAAPCLVASDCTGMGDTACLESNAECTGGFCSLDLRCSSGINDGKLCRPDDTTNFGVVSHDCPPNIAFARLQQPFGTVTTEAVELPVGAACTDPSWTNYMCPCPANGDNIGVPTKPNACSAACDGGVNAGKGCVVGGGGNGEYTTCVGGVENGKPCDENSDCDSANCSGQAKHCTAGPPSELGTICSVNADCGGGGLCEEPCPGGRCIPLCLQEGECNGGGRDGDPCATTEQCKECTAGNAALIGQACDMHSRCDSTNGSGDGFCEATLGVTCDITDPEDGFCAAGPTKYRCNGAGFGTQNCDLKYGTCSAGTCTMGSPSLRNTPCAVNSDCLELPNVPVSTGCETGEDALPGTADDIPGAGECEPRSTNCFFDNGFAEGGDTLNGQGSPTDVNINAAFCVPPSTDVNVNNASGFGGPSRVRRQGTATVNVPSIP